MSSLVTLLIQFLPKIADAVGLLGKIPDAIGTVKELKEFIEKVMAILNRPGMLTVEQRKDLDERIAGRKDLAHWKLEE
jgi:hypothetical protein